MTNNTVRNSADILVFLQQANGRIHPNSLELVTAANTLAGGSGARVFGVAAAETASAGLLESLRRLALCEVDVYAGEQYKNFIAESFSAALVDCAQRRRPGTLLVGATPEGRAVAPIAAVPLKTGVTADCTALAIDEGGLLLQTRPAYGGDIMATIVTPAARPQIATVRQGIFTHKPSCGNALIHIHEPVLPKVFPLPRVVNKQMEDAADAPESGIVVAVGGGLRKKEDLELFFAVNRALGGELFCSRSLVERGWLPHVRQIGLSGRSVAPRLLVAFGISGSVQFFAGIQGARRVFAVNTDESAPLMRAADCPIVGDMYAVADEIIAQTTRSG
ncbi:MAG: electron transfer flavoprotein subunit alpha/FixB family protein [Oscillospiraceae bacterium]|jgi:electron transfer flavoprotein alpha subunit|nr:electron transfer flavoprotein subunit alpha/FixB family protein [Oscillospiraceae bacterium]